MASHDAAADMNSRFAVATHILTLLYSMGNDPQSSGTLTSEFIAGSVNTNPVVIRRLLSVLNKAGLTTGRLGAGGGATLARPATAITLLDVHRAVGGGDLFGRHPQGPNPACPVGRHIQASLEQTTRAAERAVEDALAQQTIAGLVDEVMRREKALSTTRARSRVRPSL
jgi:DNA-binding IscR family transcriptional regulator